MKAPEILKMDKTPVFRRFFTPQEHQYIPIKKKVVMFTL